MVHGGIGSVVDIYRVFKDASLVGCLYVTCGYGCYRVLVVMLLQDVLLQVVCSV